MDTPADPPGSSDFEDFSDPRRRSPRVPHHVPVVVVSGRSKVTGESDVVNAHGALVKSPAPLPPGATVTVTNEGLAKSCEGWVIWSGPRAGEPGVFDLGIEFATPDAAFWGPGYRAPGRRNLS